MQLRQLVEEIGEKYDRSLDMSSEAQLLLRQAGATLSRWVPAGYLIKGSGGQGAAAFVPWISVFDPDETDTARHGMYVVYLFAEDMTTVSLSLNQGVTELVDRFGTREGRKRLKEQADAIRAALPQDMREGLEETITLKSRAALPINYEFGNILATTYPLDALPAEEVMVEDLHRFVRLYQEGLAVREVVRQTTPGKIVTTVQTPPPAVDKPAEFKPKNDADYTTTVVAHTQHKTRKHEKIVKEYGQFLISRGLQPNTAVHPRDMTVKQDEAEWLIEVKMVRRGDGVSAARAAIGQLLSYRYFHYDTASDNVRLLAVFNEDIGAACVDLLESLGIASVWWEDSGWTGSPSTLAAGLC